MKHYSHPAKQKKTSHFNVEFAEEFGITQPLDQEAHHAFLSAKAGGMVTKRLVEAGEKILINESPSKE